MPLALERYREFERELGPVLTRFVVDGDDSPYARSRESAMARTACSEEAEVEKLAKQLSPRLRLVVGQEPDPGGCDQDHARPLPGVWPVAAF